MICRVCYSVESEHIVCQKCEKIIEQIKNDKRTQEKVLKSIEMYYSKSSSDK